MSACDQFLPNLCAWLDEELDEEESAAMEAHVAQCASCRALAAQYRRLDAAMAAVEPPAGLHEHIMRGISAHHSPLEAPLQWRRPQPRCCWPWAPG